jgi:LPXTG-motif cell wall-anchored protein
MKTSLVVVAGLAIVAAAVYYFRNKKQVETNNYPEKENERHHLTNIFSKAKEVALGN